MSIFVVTSSLFAQNQLIYIKTDTQSKWHSYIVDSLKVDSLISQKLLYYEKKGFLEAEIFSPKSTYYEIHLGQKYVFKKINPIDTTIFKAAGLTSNHHFQLENISFEKWQNIQNKILTYAENNGYPFASVKLQNFNFQKKFIIADLVYQKGSLIAFDSIFLQGNVKIKSSFLKKYLRLKGQEVFTQKKIEQAEWLLKELLFLRVDKKSEVSFKDDRAILKCFLSNEKSNQFDGVVGFLPNSNGQGLSFTGQISLLLNNLFHSAKSLQLDWNRIKPRSQILQINYTHPIFLGSKFDLQIGFSQIKEDTFFTNIQRKIQISHFAPQIGKFLIGVEWHNSNLLSKPIETQKNERTPMIDNYLLSYQLGFIRKRVNDNFLPTRGYIFQLQTKAGNKELIKSSFIDSTTFSKYIPKTAFFQINIGFEQYRKIAPKTIFAQKINLGSIENLAITQNDLLRLGGLRTLRGFGENVFFAKKYIFNNFELRLMTERYSYLFIFSDQAIIENLTESQFVYGFGAGMSLRLKAGIFNFVYALGKSETQNISLGQSKIHFGLVSRF